MIAIAVAAVILGVVYFMLRPQKALSHGHEVVITNGTVSVGPLSSYMVNFTVPPTEGPETLYIHLTSSQPVFVYVVNGSELVTLMKTGGAASLLYKPDVTNLTASLPLPGPGSYSIVVMNKASLSTVYVNIYAYLSPSGS
ncbi:MAG: hypothetical protein ACP5FT_02285 [Acidilobus sp.]